MSSSLSPVSVGAFSAEQKEYLAGLLAAAAHRAAPYVGQDAAGKLTADPSAGGPNQAAPATFHGVAVDDLCKQERWKFAEHPADGWDRVVAHAEGGRRPDEEDTYRLRNFGLFYVGPTQDSFMLRCRIPAGELTADQFQGLAALADEFGNGRTAITTRSNIQIREIAPRHLVQVFTRLQGLGLTSRGSGVDNVRNITVSPTAGFDPQELLDPRPYGHALHHYILNQRDSADLPRKFNVAFEGGGSVDNVTETNDLGFMAVKVPAPAVGKALRDGAPVAVEPGVYFRVELAGVSGHRQLASDVGLVVRPGESVAVSAAIIRTFAAHGDRTDRKKARLKHLLDRWGTPRFLEEVQKRLAFPLVQLPAASCSPRSPSLKHGHLGVYRQRQPGRNYFGVVVPVGILTARQMNRLADLARNYGSGGLRLTPWQNVILPDVPDAFVETVKRQLVRLGLHHEASHVAGGIIACTGSTGCKWAASDTKGHGLALIRHLEKRVQLDRPVNIHVTGCPNSCAQHYVGDIGLQGVKVSSGGESVDGYHIVFGGGVGSEAGIGRQVFSGIPFTEIPVLLERVLGVYLARRMPGESFAAFTRRHELGQLQELFSR